MEVQDFGPEIPADLREAWDVGRRHFGNDVYFYAPSIKRYATSEYENGPDPVFAPVSLTGPACALRCEHCRGRILESMYPATTTEEFLALAARLAEQGARGLLVSSGSDALGFTRLHHFLPALARVKERYGLALLVHTGLVDDALAAGLASAGVDLAMIDVIGDAETIRRVYHLDRTPADFDAALAALARNGVPVAPHVVIGLHYGQIRGEYAALDLIRRYDVHSLVLVVLMPLDATPMAHVEPPPPAEVARVFARARTLFPDRPVMLGCARPGGDHKVETDVLALKAGLNGIAYPADGLVELARDLGLNPHFAEECCSLVYTRFPAPGPALGPTRR